MANIIAVSFKENSKEKPLFLAVKTARNQSDFIKDAIEFYLKYHDKQLKVVEVQSVVEEKKEVKEESIDPKAKAALNQFFMEDDE